MKLAQFLATFLRKCVAKKLKNRPIWSHWPQPIISLTLEAVKLLIVSNLKHEFHAKQICACSLANASRVMN